MLKSMFRICVIAQFVSFAVIGGAAGPVPQVFRVVNAPGESQYPSGGGTWVRLPVLGFVVDGTTHGLRPLTGVSGSASIGAPLDLGFEVTSAAIPPGHDYLLVQTSDGKWSRLLQVRGDTIIVRSLNAADYLRRRPHQICESPHDVPRRRGQTGRGCPVEASPPTAAITIDRIALSPTGSAAALLSETENRIYVFANLSRTPLLRAVFDVAALGTVSAFAVSDDARMTALGIAGETTGTLILLTDGNAPRRMGSIIHPSAISFLRNSNELIVADGAENMIYALDGEQLLTLATSENGISGPVGIALSEDNRHIFIGNSRSGSITTIDRASLFTEIRYCNCALTGLYPTSTGSVFRVTDFSGGPLSLFDASGPVPRIVFVPAGLEF